MDCGTCVQNDSMKTDGILTRITEFCAQRTGVLMHRNLKMKIDAAINGILPELDADRIKQMHILQTQTAVPARRLTKTFPKRPAAFLIYADLDGTFTPVDLSGWLDFVDIVKEIMERLNVDVKFIPVSGRPGGYVLRVVHAVRDMMKGEGFQKVCEFGAAEQGAVIVDSSRSYGPTVTIKPENCGLKPKIAEILKNNEHADIIADELDKLYTCSIHIKNEAKEHMTIEQQGQVYYSVRDDVEAKFGVGTLNMSMAHNCMEVMTTDVSKAHAMDMLWSYYAKDYNIVGLCYCGDAENDKIAMTHISKLAEIPGVNAHNFIPANAQEAINSPSIDQWKFRYRSQGNPWAHAHYVEKAELNLFKGISQLMRKAIDEKRLCGRGVEMWKTRDDACPKHLQDLRWPSWRAKPPVKLMTKEKSVKSFEV